MPVGFQRHSPALGVCLGLFIGIFILYGQAANHEFIAFDDDEYIYNNPDVRDGISWDGFRKVWTLSRWGNWHPLTWLSLMADSEMFGADKEKAGGHVLVNVALHATNAVLVFLLLRTLSGQFWLSALVAAAFAWHPLRVEAVAWACQRKEVLSGFFGLLTIWAYVKYARHPSVSRYFLVFFALTLAMLSKQTLVALPAVLLLLDFWPLGRLRKMQWDGSTHSKKSGNTPPSTLPASLARLVVEKIPLLLLCAGAALIAFGGASRQGATFSADDLPVHLRLANAAVAYVTMLGKTIWPKGLTCFYPHPGVIYENAFQRLALPALAAIVFLAVVSVVVLWNAPRRPYLAVGWLWYLILLFPMSGVAQSGYHSMADRFTYLPLTGIFIMFAWGVLELTERSHRLRNFCVVAMSIILLGCAYATFVQVATWRNTITVFQHAVRVTSDNYLAHYNLGVALVDRAFRTGDQKTARLDWDAAQYHFQRACEIKPDLARHHVNLGLLYLQEQRVDDAIGKFEDALNIDSRHPRANLNLALALLKKREVANAIDYFRVSLREDPNNPETHRGLATALQSQGKTEEAIREYQIALQLNPNLVAASKRLAWILATSTDPHLRNGAGAVQLAEHAARLTNRKRADVLDTLAVAYAEVGRFPEAIRTTEQALALLKDDNSTTAQGIRSRLELFQAGRPYRAP